MATLKNINFKKYAFLIVLFLLSTTFLSGCFQIISPNNLNTVPRVTITATAYYEENLYANGQVGTVRLQNTSNNTGLAQVNIRKDANLVLTANPKSGYIFTGWYTHNPETLISVQSEVTISVNTYYVENITELNFYAHFIIDAEQNNVYQVEFNLLNGQSGQNIVIEANQNTVIGTKLPSSPTREGFTFLGWNTLANGNGQAVNANTIVSKNLTVYAVWTANYYTISFNANGGQLNSFNSYQVMHNVSLQQVLPESPQRENYIFTGWNTASNGTGQTVSEQTVVNSNTTLYAMWQANTIDYVVSFDKQGGTGGTNSVNARINNSMPSVTAPTLSGWIFGGYYSQPGGQGTQYYIYTGSPNLTNIKAWDKSQDATLYAKWTATLTLNANGSGAHIHGNNNWTGQGSTVTKSIIFNTVLTLPVYGAGGITRTGYAFIEWNTQADGNGTGYYTQNTYNSISKTLYAKWSPNYYQVTLVAGTGIDWVQGAGNYSAGQTVSINAEILSGYSFYRWSGEFVTYTKSYNFTMPSKNITLEAVATKTIYEITINATGGTVNLNGTTLGIQKVVDDGTLQPFVLPSPIREGYLFMGWFDKRNGFGEQHQVVSSIKRSYELFAHWQEYRQVNFSTNGGQNMGPIITKPNVRVPEVGNFAHPYRQGYRFMGWSTINYGNYTPTITIQFIENITQDITLYAHWQALPNSTYTVTFNSNGGSAVPNVYLQNGESLSLYASMFMPTRRGYTFQGWFTSNNTQVTSINQINKDTNLQAKWQLRTHTVSFSSAGGSAVNSIIANYGVRVPSENLLPTPTRAGYIFRGWYTESDGKGIRYTHIPKLTKDIALFAYWQVETANALKIEQNYLTNLILEKNANIFDYQGFINFQPDTSIFKYGATTSENNGCGWIGTYNMLTRLKNMGKYDFDISIADMIREYEYNGIVNNGNWGTWPEAIYTYLEKLGLNVNIYYNLIVNNYSDKIINSSVSLYGYLEYNFRGHYQTVYYEDNLFYCLNPSYSATTLDDIKADCLVYVLITIN